MANSDIRLDRSSIKDGKSSRTIDDLGKTSLEKEKELEKLKLEAKARANKTYRDNEEKAHKAYQKAIQRIELEAHKKTLDEKLKATKDAAKEELLTASNNAQKIAAITKSTLASAAQTAINLGKQAASAVGSGINDYLGVYSQYMSGIETRLQGSAKTFSSITGTINGAIGSSQYVSQRKVLENLSKMVEQGIAYNVEQRAFLSTVSDRIASTFNAFDSNLTRIIRLQQADSTVARLGMESVLTKFLNGAFQDTSYLNGLSKNVSGAILSASSTMGRNKSVEFEYAVQKWLGSMSSVGVSDATIQSIAQGIGYLGSGNVSALGSNSSLQNLLVMAANNAGLDYSSLLTGGMSSANTNKLLKGIVTLSQDIANNNNRVVLSQYAQIFGMDITDLMAMGNLTSQNLLDISSNMLEYEKLYSETENQISTIGSRMTIKNRIDTMFENIMSSVGENIASSAAQYTTWLVTDMIKNAGDINVPVPIPFTGIYNLPIAQSMQSTMVLGNALSQIGSILAGLSGKNSLSLDKWGAEDVMSKGIGFTGLSTTGVSSTTSQTVFIGNSSSSDIYEGSIASSKEETKRSIASEDDSSNDLAEIIRDRIAPDVSAILQLLGTDGIVVKEISPWAMVSGGGNV